MNEPQMERIRLLERSVRRWKRATLGLILVVAVLLALWAGLGVRLLFESLPSVRERALRAEEEAMMQREEALVQREVAERESRRALQALHQAQEERDRAEKALRAAQANQQP
jgi:hypothetical protein